MEQNETKAVLRLLYAVATADGTVDAEERRALAVAAEHLAAELDEGSVDVAVEAAKIVSPTARLATFEAAIALAVIDGRCTPEEHALLEVIRRVFALDLPMPVAERERTWEERTRDARAAMRSAEVDFLHSVARKREGSLSQDEYRALVAELQREQMAALHETLDPAFDGTPSYVVLPPS